jgi:hypothetical protein
MRIVQLAHPEATITFVKVRSGAMHTSKGRDLTVYDEWLTVACTTSRSCSPWARTRRTTPRSTTRER